MDPFEFLRPTSPRKRFAKRVMGRLRKLGWTERMVFHEPSFSVDVGGDAGTMHLHNIHQEWRNTPWLGRRKCLDGRLAYVFELRPDLSFEEAKPLLLPLVRNRSHMGFARLAPEIEDFSGFSGAAEPLGEILVALAAIDRPHSTQLINAAQLAEWGCGLDEVMGIALANLGLKSPGRFEAAGGGFYVSDYGDYHDASRLLLPHLFNSLRLTGDPVAVVVSRACLVVAGSEDAAGLEAMAGFVRFTMKDEVRPISYAPLVLIDGAWRPFRPEDDARIAMRDLWLTQWLWDDAEQTSMLQSDFDVRGQDVYVASLHVLAVDEDRGRTWTGWEETVPTCLPRAEVLILVDQAKVAHARRWEDVEAVLGPFEALPGIWPPRFMTSSWPDEAAWRRLVACPVAPGFAELEGPYDT